MTSSDLATGLGRNTSMCAATPVVLPCPVGWSQAPSSRDTSADRHFTSAVQSPGYSNNLTRCVPTAHPYYSCTMCTLYILGLHGHFNEFLHWAMRSTNFWNTIWMTWLLSALRRKKKKCGALYGHLNFFSHFLLDTFEECFRLERFFIPITSQRIW